MSNDALNAILDQLPKVQQEIAKRKIASAEAFGWTEIFLATIDGAEPHHYDLMGRAPASQLPTCLPEVDDVKE